MGAAGAASAEQLIKHWDAIWAKIDIWIMHPPGLAAPIKGKSVLIARMRGDSNQFMDSFLQPVSSEQVVANFLSLIDQSRRRPSR
jgi:hypothetical protein